jgi:hypothetical protein
MSHTSHNSHTFPFLLLFVVTCAAQDPAPPEPPAVKENHSETRFSLALTDEGSFYTGLRVPIPEDSNVLLIQPRFSYRYGDLWRFTTSLLGEVNTNGDTHTQLAVQETYLGFSPGDFDLTVGKRILKWSVGYAFAPAGILDPARNPTDPTDHLSLNQGREMATADWIKGSQSLTVAWASGGLLDTHPPTLKETLAFRYNVLMRGWDTSVIVGQDRGAGNFYGANFTRVFGQAIEIHGEAGVRHNAMVLFGGKYTHRSGWGGIVEYYRPDGSVTPVAGLPPVPPGDQYLFARAAKSRVRELPGWKEWDVAVYMIMSLRDGSRVWVGEVDRRFGNRCTAYVRGLAPGGDKLRSEFGMIPFSSTVSLGLRFQL